MANVVFVKNYTAPKINEKEILRYAGVKESTREISVLLQECIKEAQGLLSYKVCYSEFAVSVFEENVDIGFAVAQSKDLAHLLKDCSKCLVFCATIGIGLDRLIAKYSVISPTKALIFQALGAERIESLSDLFNEEVTRKYKHTKPRFSPGYGDLDLQLQRAIFSSLDCSKKIGVTLNDSLLMSPTKSVTAIIGICDKDECVETEKCIHCQKNNCAFRK